MVHLIQRSPNGIDLTRCWMAKLWQSTIRESFNKLRKKMVQACRCFFDFEIKNSRGRYDLAPSCEGYYLIILIVHFPFPSKSYLNFTSSEICRSGS